MTRSSASGTGTDPDGASRPEPQAGSLKRPRLRALEAFPIEHGGRRVVGLRDPAGFTDQIAFLPAPLLDLVSLFDGEHSIPEIQGVLRARYGRAPTAGEIARVIDRFDDAGFLESSRFARRRKAIEAAFTQSAVRPPAHAGSAYATEPSALRTEIEAFFADPDGPGSQADAGRRARTVPPLRGLIAPHIDFRRGGATYGWAYRELSERSDADLFVILGTCHAGMPDPFAATLKPFETPLGTAEVDHDFFEALRRRYGGDLLASELAHRSEHSIEFQAVMLRYLLGERRPFTILPVLASFLHEAVWTRADPEADRRVPRFVDALLAAMAVSRRKVCVIAGVDLAHVGPRFGDPIPNTAEFLEEVGRRDRAMLESVVAGDAIGFYSSVCFDRDARRICGLSPMYIFLRALPGVSGRLLRYSQWPDAEGAVTFCAAAFP